MEWLPEWGGTTCRLPQESNEAAGRAGCPQGSKETQRASPPPTLSPPAGEDRKGTYSDTLKRLGGDHKEKDKNDLINNWTSSENTQETSSHEADENVSETSYWSRGINSH